MVANPRHATALSSTHARNSARQFPRSKNANVPHGETMPHLGCHMQVHTAHKLLPEGASVGTVYIVRTLITPAAGALIVWCFHSAKRFKLQKMYHAGLRQLDSMYRPRGDG